MKSLFQYIVEARGIVTGEYDWSGLVKTIMSYMPDIEIGKYEMDEKELPSWLIFLTVEVIPSGQASYEYTQSRLIGDKLDAYIRIPQGRSQSWYNSALNHELQHAFDDWIGRTRRGKNCGFDEKYCISTGFEDGELDWGELYDLVAHPEKCTFNHIFNILSQSTYALNESEVNAYLREFNIYISGLEQTGQTTWSFNDVLAHPDNGLCPLICLDCLWGLKSNLDKIDVKDEDWQWIADSINFKWSSMFLGHIVSGTGKEVIIRIVNELFKRYGVKIAKRYKRILGDHNMELKDAPAWFK